MSAEYNLYSYIYTCMKTWPCFEKQLYFWSRVRWRLGKKTRCYFCDINLPCILFSKLLIAPLVVMNWRSLSWKLRPVSNLKKPLNGSMKIFRVDLQKAKNNIKNKIEGYPRVERGNISLFSFYKQFWNIPTPLWFSRNPLRELHGQNIFTWTILCLQRIITEIRWGFNEHKRKLDHAKTRFIWTIRFSDQLLAGSLVEIWQLIRRQQTTNHKYCFSTNQIKNQHLVFEHMIRQVNVSSPPSLHLNTEKEGMIAG